LSYWVCVVARDAFRYIPRTLDSLLMQSSSARRILVVDDGSTDGTQRILGDYRKDHSETLDILTLPDRGYDIRRVQHNINLAWAKASKSGPKTDLFMITGDDCYYPESYAEVLITRMMRDSRIVVASGKISGESNDSADMLPTGSGRMVRCDFWQQIGGRYPIRAGGETWLVYKALELGLKANIFEDISYQHLRPQGSQHQFVDWGASMHNLGYNPLFVIGRLVRNLVKRKVGVKGSLNMVRGYLQGVLGSSDLYFGPYENSLRNFISSEQRKRITRVVTSRFKILG
jgi:glycosyltransferase involved in cell wall biosynthesis